MYYIFIVVLENCLFSMYAMELLKKYNINFKHLKVTSTDKDTYKTQDIQTFPQVYLKKKSTEDSLLLGGYTDLKKFFDIFIDVKYDENNVIKFQKKYPLWNKHSVLRLIELINLKRLH